MQAQLAKARAPLVDERGGAEMIDEAPELPARGRVQPEIDVVDGDAAVGEEAQRLARFLAVVEAEDLDVYGGGLLERGPRARLL